MRIVINHFFAFSIMAVCMMVTSYFFICLAAEFKRPEPHRLTRLFPADVKASVLFDESIIATSLLDLSQGHALIIVPASNGIVAALNGDTGTLEWQIKLPAPNGQQAQLISTPVTIDNKLVVLYQCVEKSVRTSHRLVVIDLTEQRLDEHFPVLELSAEKPTVDGVATVSFNPATAFSHSAVKHTKNPGSQWGYLYAAFGNAGDTQPFHGWLFEVDMDAWQQHGTTQAIRNVLLTTPEVECPVSLAYGTQEMICGGGIWTPAGPQLYSTLHSFELFVPTGNGQVDLTRHDYANTLMRVQPGLQFDPGCDERACKNFNASQPNTGCMASCKNLFIPRLAEGNKPLKPSSGECNDKSFSECLAWMDYDLGGNSPVKVDMVSGYSVLVQPGKDGAVYLIDAKHLGTQYDRLQIMDVCGTPTDVCKAGWMGMIVTQPALTLVDNVPVVIIPGFVPDKTHPAGVVALKIVLEKGMPKFKRFWQFPEPSTAEALQTFRSHPSLPVISTIGQNSDAIVWVVDIGATGTLYGIRVKDGALVVKQALLGAGRQLSAPLIYNDTVYLASIMPNTGKALIEAYHIQ